MIIDCQTHLWDSVEQLGPDALAHLRREGGAGCEKASPVEHSHAAGPVDKSLVLGIRSAHLGAMVPNEIIASYVASRPDRLIGIAAVDPGEPGAIAEAGELLDKSEFRGLTISPSWQNFHPADSRAMGLYELAAERRAPVFVSEGTHFATRGHMEYARPMHWDEIASEFPSLTLVVASLGHPWVEEAIALIGKHPRVYASVAGLLRRPWQAYNALVLAHQYNVMDKVLFGSDFPYMRAADAIKSVYRLHEVTQGTNLPSVPREVLRGMIERNALQSLGIASPQEAVTAPVSGEDDDEDEEI
jgi:hypothetical protein